MSEIQLTNLNMPASVAAAQPGAPYVGEETYEYDHVPSLKELLPKFRGVPGFQYFQCCVVNLRRAQDEGWTEVVGGIVYRIKGPKGSVDMKLLTRGERTPGAAHNSGARICGCNTLVQELTGVWINPNRHTGETPEIGPERPNDLASQPERDVSGIGTMGIQPEGTPEKEKSPPIFRAGGKRIGQE